MTISMNKFFVLTALLSVCSVSQAQSFYVGTFRPYFYANGLYIEETSVQKGAIPACATRATLRLSADPASAEFKEQYAMLLSAWYAGRALSIAGAGTCTSDGDEVILQILPQ